MVNAIPDIPRLYTAIAEWLCAGLLVFLLGVRVKKLSFAIISAIYLTLVVLFMETTATINIWLWVPCMIVAFLFIVGFIVYCSRTTFFDGIYYAIIAFSVAECMASLEWQIVNFLYKDVDHLSIQIEALILVIVYGLFLCVVFLLFKNKISPSKRLQIERKDSFVALLIGVIIFFFSNLSFIIADTPFAGQYSREIATIRTVVDIAGIAILYAHLVSCRDNMINRELDAVQNTLQNQYLQYKQSRESIDIINMKYHDLKHQIEMLRKLDDREQRDAFLDRMEMEIKSYELQNKTGNSVLDTLLTSKSVYCSNHGITLTVVADGKLLGFMDAMDICSIFGNALDNAIESAMKVEEKEKRLIHLTVSKVKSFIMIHIRNYYVGDINYRDGDLVSTKKDNRFHGYGIKSIKHTATRYDGVVSINTDNNWFELKIIIPCNE